MACRLGCFFYIPTVDTPVSRIQFSSQWVIWEFNLISLAPFTINKFEWISKGMRRWNWKNWGSSWKNERENWGLVEGKKESNRNKTQANTQKVKEKKWVGRGPVDGGRLLVSLKFTVFPFHFRLTRNKRKHREKNKTISISKLILIMNTNFSSLFILCHLDRKWVLSVFDLMRDDIMEWSLSICIRRRANAQQQQQTALRCERC